MHMCVCERERMHKPVNKHLSPVAHKFKEPLFLKEVLMRMTLVKLLLCADTS